MATDNNRAQADAAFRGFCKMMDAKGWKYDIVEDYLIETGYTGEDLPIRLHIKLDPKLHLIRLFSLLPVTVPKDKLLDISVATAVINNRMIHGSFDLDVSDGTLLFRLSSCYEGMTLTEETYQYLLFCPLQSIEAYNDKLFMIAKGVLSLEDFLKAENA